VDHFAGTGFLDCSQQFRLDHPVMDNLALRHMDDDHPDLKLGEVLLELKAAVNGQKNVEVRLGDC
jgi:hypothetical protein